MSLSITSKSRPKCPLLCPGCTHGKLNTEQSLALKQQRLFKHLAPWSNRIAPIRTSGPEAQWRYRSSVCLKTAWDESGWRFGLMARKTVIPIHDCPVHADPVRRAVNLLAGKLPGGDAFPAVYYLQSGAQATLVIKTKTMPDMAWLDAETAAGLAAAGIEGLWLHMHPAAGKRIAGKSGWFLAWGQPESNDSSGLIYGPSSFRQVIGLLADHALSAAETFLAPRQDDLMVDLYCGIGPGLVRWALRQCRTVGVELNGEAVSCARCNAPEATVLRGRCGLRLPQLSEWLNDQTLPENTARLLYANPPRMGIEKNVLEWITATYRPQRMAYLSCNAAALSRDLSFLASSGYTVSALLPYDFFPRTHHVECLALLTSHRCAAH